MTKDELIKARAKLVAWSENAEGTMEDILSEGEDYQLDVLIDDLAALTTIIKALDAQIKACDVPKLEGFGHTLKDTRIVENEIRCMSNYEAKQVLEAARAYHKMTGGE
jgi:hypothetical protein